MSRNEYIDWMSERLQPLGNIRFRRMFGSWGLYCDGLFFAIASDDVLYLKVDAISLPEFEAAGLAPFTYVKQDGRLQSMRYYPLPDSAIDDDAEFLLWAQKGLAAALRARKG